MVVLGVHIQIDESVYQILAEISKLKSHSAFILWDQARSATLTIKGPSQCDSSLWNEFPLKSIVAICMWGRPAVALEY